MFHKQEPVLFFMRFFKKLWRFFNRSRQIRCLPVNHMPVSYTHLLGVQVLVDYIEGKNKEYVEKILKPTLVVRKTT